MNLITVLDQGWTPQWFCGDKGAAQSVVTPSLAPVSIWDVRVSASPLRSAGGVILAVYIPLKLPPLCPPLYLLLPWTAELWYPPSSLGPHTRADPGQTGVGPRMPGAPMAVRKGPWEKCWLGSWGRWGCCRSPAPHWCCWLWGGCCRCDRLCWSWCCSFSCCRCWGCCRRDTAGFELSSWSVVMVVLPVNLVLLAVPTVLVAGGAPSPLIGWSWTDCVSLREETKTRVNRNMCCVLHC